MSTGEFILRDEALRINLSVQVPEVHARSSRKILDAAEHGAKAAVKAYAEYIKALPAVDAVKVVRCRECRYSTGDEEFRCCEIWNTANMPGSGFCFMGERKSKK